MKMYRSVMIFMLSFAFMLITHLCAHATDVHAKEEKGHACYEKAGIHRGGYIHDYIGMYKDHAKELGLSKGQTEKLAALDTQCTATCNRLSADIDEAERELDALVKKDVIDGKTIREKIKTVHRLKERLELEHFEMLEKAQRILTLEQREKCRKMCETKSGKDWPKHH